MPNDPHIIARQSAQAGGAEVLAQRHEVMFSDGSAVQLHPLQRHGLPLLTERAMQVRGRLHLVDLARLVPRLDTELRTAPARDLPGLVFYTLRQAYGTAAVFVADVERHACGNWWAVGDGYVWQPAPRAVDTKALACITPLPAHRCAA